MKIFNLFLEIAVPLCYYENTKRKWRIMSAKHIVDIKSYDGKSVYGKINLVQIGRLACEGGHTIAKHTHLNWFELTCIVEGEGEILGGDTQVKVKQGDVFLSFPCEAHAIYSSKTSPLTFDHFAFYTADAEYSDRLERIMAVYSRAEKRVFKSFRVKDLLDSCISGILASGEFQNDYLMSSFSLIVLELVRIFKVKSGAGIIGTGVEEPEELCRTLKRYIDTHLFSIGSLSELASLCGYNYSYLSFLFRKVTGTTLSDYYKQKRFESAKLMIKENRLKIGEISNLLGYNSVYAFSKAFKDEFGVSPRNYYKSAKSGEN